MAFLFKNKKLPEGVDPSRIPPGQTLTAPDKWPLLHFGPVPKTDIAKWDLKVFGAVEHELRLDYGELRALPSKDVVADIHCVTAWSRLGDTWTGVPIKEILDRVKPKPEARYVMAHCEYGYTTSVPLDVLASEDNLLCYGWKAVRAFEVLLEVGQVASRARVHGTQPAGILGAAWVPRRSRSMEGDTLLVAAV